MPPANSPSETPFGYPIAHSPYLESLQELDSPVPDLASTLTTQAEDEADEDNVSFLRTRSRYHNEAAAGHMARRRQPHLTAEEYDRLQLEHQRRLLRTISDNLPHQSPGREQDLWDVSDPAYGDRIPQQQSLYDWAPGSSDDEDDEVSPQRQYQAQLRDLQQTQFRRRQREAETRARAPTTYPSRIPELSQTLQPPSDSSLRMAALLQSVHRHGRYSSRSRSQLQNYILDRERTGHDAEERERSNSTRLYRPSNPTPTSTQQQQQQQRELRARVDAYRQRYIENPSSNMPAVSRWLEETIKYLERLRFSNSYEESLCVAAAGGFVREGFLTDNHEDFVLDTADIEPPPESSWLKVGGVFSGSQHAAHGSQHSRLNPHGVSPPSNGPPIVTGSTPSRMLPPGDSRFAWTQGPTDPRPVPVEEKWPVKVTIHSIDYENMTLAGTMEAFNVPDASSPTRKSSIVTFLEGEIVDFNTYTLETKSFSADAKIDGTYWRMLEPFKRLSDEEVVRNLLSKRWLTEELAKNWILMRWKEKCFITPSDYRSGLTISGFYYVSLRRDNGHIEGLYHDPSSSPYQQLIITPEKRTFPTYEFR
ncbi:MAG: hypothetical protein M1812_002631 [Candelaria pacifica]|nr:MAG: hypothetical protein M1812_002631 [Candelaria pacifica]